MGRARELAEVATAYEANGLNFRNRIINGDMRIDQRNNGAAVTVNNTAGFYAVDRFLAVAEPSFGVYTLQRSTIAPSGFTNSMLATVTTAAATPASGHQYNFMQRIEGFNVADLGFGTAAAQSITLSFWVRSSVTGTFAGGISSSSGNRSYVFTYTISAANTFEYKTVTIPGDTTGTWLTDNGIGFRVIFDLGSGSSYQATAGSWGGAYSYATSGSVKLMATNGATFYITGVQLEAGSVATPFERRPYGTELALCQRYYTKLTSFVSNGQILSGFSTAATSAWCQVFTPVAFRASPTIGFSNLIVSDQVNYALTITAIAGSAQTINGGGVAFTNNTGATAFRPCAINTSSSSGYLDFSAEL